MTIAAPLVAPDALIFVYNANAGLVAGLMDSVHKTLSPATYPCSLCAATYGALSMRPEWRRWLKAQRWQAVFHHRPDFRAAYPAFADTPLPAIFRRDAGAVALLIPAEEMDALTEIPALIAAIEARLGAAALSAGAAPG